MPLANDKGPAVGTPERIVREPWLCRLSLDDPEATKRHFDVRDVVLQLTHLADPRAGVEAPGLIPSAPALRPADILTSAAYPGRLAALDIGISSPEASGAGSDCCAAMFDKKVRNYGPHLAELTAADVVYKPLVWSAFGREHPETSIVMETLARQAARRCGLRDHRLLLRRARAAVGAHLARRAVRMARACLNEGDAEDELFGEAPAEALGSA